MKKIWTAPQLEILDVSMTMNGPGNANPDCFDVTEPPGETHPGRSNASCKDKGALDS